jgi:hypothetical protein
MCSLCCGSDGALHIHTERLTITHLLYALQCARQKLIWAAAKFGDKTLLQRYLAGATVRDFKFEKMEVSHRVGIWPTCVNADRSCKPQQLQLFALHVQLYILCCADRTTAGTPRWA